MDAKHDSVLLSETLEMLDVLPSDTLVDATLGGAGHFEAFLKGLGGDGILVGIDADPEAVERARNVYAEDRRPDKPVAHLVNDNFRRLSPILDRLSIPSVDKILFDLGWSGYQVAAARGFSFQGDEPLLMTYAPEEKSAAEFVNSVSEEDLADALYAYGEERFARTIARSIVAARAKERILTTGVLVEAVKQGTPAWYHRGKIHPATKTFQALRIAVNDEFGALREGIAAALERLSEGGRIAVITFHSAEDRMVKLYFRQAVERGFGFLVTKKVVTPSRAEVLHNRRSRSAKLRVFERTTAQSIKHTPVHHYV